MKSILHRILVFAAAWYDKLLAVVAFGLLLWAVLALVSGRKQLQGEALALSRWIEVLQPMHPEAQRADLTSYERALASIDAPFQLGEPERPALIAEMRITCHFCTFPKPYESAVCPHCGEEEKEKPPPPPEVDLDQDGMKDAWELLHGFDPRNPADAALDADGDGFTNIEEHDAGTDPRDFASHPSLLDRMAILRIVAVPFPFQFKAVNRLGPDQVVVQLNDLRGRSYYLKSGDTIPGAQYRLVGYDERIVERVVEGTEMVRQVDESQVVLQHLADEKKQVTLVKDVLSKHFEYGAEVRFRLDGSTYKCWMGQSFTLNGRLHGGRVFTVKDVDMPNRRVVIRDDHFGREKSIREGEGL